MHGVSGRNSVVLAFVCIKTPSMEGPSKWERYSRSQSGKELISIVSVCLGTVPSVAGISVVAALKVNLIGGISESPCEPALIPVAGAC